jgi:glucan phosphoethanolaminetransferase (alkaline phosphatase superfamily)
VDAIWCSALDNLRSFLIGAPWVTASWAAFYALSQWKRLPPLMAVHFTSILGSVPNGWHPKAQFFATMLLLMFGLLTLFTVMLSMPARVRMREGALSDPVTDRQHMIRIVTAAHIFVGVWMPISIAHIINFNL